MIVLVLLGLTLALPLAQGQQYCRQCNELDDPKRCGQTVSDDSVRKVDCKDGLCVTFNNPFARGSKSDTLEFKCE